MAKKHSSEKNYDTNNNCVPVSFLTAEKDRSHSAMEVDANPKSLACGQSFCVFNQFLCQTKKDLTHRMI